MWRLPSWVWCDQCNSLHPLLICNWFFVNWVWKIKLGVNLIFCLFWTWILQATQAVKVKFEIEKKSSSSNLIFQTQFFKYQVKSNKFENLVTLLKWAVWSGTLFTLKIDPEFSNMNREIGGLDYLKVLTKNTLIIH